MTWSHGLLAYLGRKHGIAALSKSHPVFGDDGLVQLVAPFLALHPVELISLWRQLGMNRVYNTFSNKFKQRAEFSMEQCYAGCLFSLVGEFDIARDLFQSALHRFREANLSMDSVLAEILISLSNNEVRYWDKLGRWESPQSLSLLLESSLQAVELLQDKEPQCLTDKILLAKALSWRANGCFKAACRPVPGGVHWRRYLEEAHARSASAGLLVQNLDMQVVGEILLHDGVILAVMLNKLEEQRDASQAALRAMRLYYRSEVALRSAVGSINEFSMWTHWMLGDLFLGDQLDLAVLHHRHSCIVAVHFFGMDHPHTDRRMREMRSLFEMFGFRDLVATLNDGRPWDIDPNQIVQRFRNRRGLGHHRARFVGNLDLQRAFNDIAPQVAPLAFWGSLWKDMGIVSKLAGGLRLPHSL